MLVLHNAGHWGLPKGHPNENEEPKETAKRELFEETGQNIDEMLDVGPFSDHYEVNGEPKEVTYYPAKVSGDIVPQEGEIQAVKWVDLDDLHEVILFDSLKQLLSQVRQAIGH